MDQILMIIDRDLAEVVERLEEITVTPEIDGIIDLIDKTIADIVEIAFEREGENTPSPETYMDLESNDGCISDIVDNLRIVTPGAEITLTAVWEPNEDQLDHEFDSDCRLLDCYDNYHGYKYMLEHQFEIVQVQHALYSELVALDRENQKLREKYEALVHQTPGLSRLSLPPKVKKGCVFDNWEHYSPGGEICECEYCFNDLKEEHFDSLEIIKSTQQALKDSRKEHRELLEEYGAFKKFMSRDS
ncbi:uncharacterized protein EAE98_000521 [Botrytis deweyae]|uniref:Inhibitor of growth protein N-terminal histone-binding domain-containing protein n=1 Tax=Botrytis deweyae TaxID=2478750 RepID=A0ABQ7J2X6_9HELO|nr:uncharacterized protein EAE98_000521 [Botrytis deweyae]KAF7940394.1 hypothetical protein EAE98_000521 [Botrytis deweyae]